MSVDRPSCHDVEVEDGTVGQVMDSVECARQGRWCQAGYVLTVHDSLYMR